MTLSQKYHTIRDRFFGSFYFEGMVAQSVDLTIPGGTITFADQTIYMGQALDGARDRSCSR